MLIPFSVTESMTLKPKDRVDLVADDVTFHTGDGGKFTGGFQRLSQRDSNP